MLGEALRLIRVYHDMTLTELAEKLGVSPGHLSSIENERKKPTLELIDKYAEVFQTSSSAILFFSEDLTRPAGPVKVGIRTGIIKFLKAIENGSKDLSDRT